MGNAKVSDAFEDVVQVIPYLYGAPYYELIVHYFVLIVQDFPSRI